MNDRDRLECDRHCLGGTPAAWGLRDGVERQFGDRCQSFGGILFRVSDGVSLLDALDLLSQGLKLCEEQRVGKYCPHANSTRPTGQLSEIFLIDRPQHPCL